MTEGMPTRIHKTQSLLKKLLFYFYYYVQNTTLFTELRQGRSLQHQGRPLLVGWKGGGDDILAQLNVLSAVHHLV